MKLSVQFEVLDMDENFIAVPIGDNADKFKGALQLNEEAAAMVRLLQNDITEEQMVAELSNEYDSADGQMLQAVHSFVEQLRANGLIVE